MVIRLVYNNKAFKIIDNYRISTSNSEVTFNDITIDFTNHLIEDIPYKFQEVQIIKADTEQDILNGEIIFTGYVDEVNLSEMKMKNGERELNLTLLSPLKLATKRFVSLIGTNNVSTAINKVLTPLLNDGFVISQMNIDEGQITTNFLIETIENCMNTICRKRNIFWYINEKKEIYINSIEYLFAQSSKKIINENIKEKGLLRIQPSIQNIDYANIINFKNVKLIYTQQDTQTVTNTNNDFPIIAINKQIKNGDIINFNNPIIIDENQLRNRIEEEQIQWGGGDNFPCFQMFIETNGDSRYYFIGLRNNQFTSLGSIGFDDDEQEYEVVLQRDSFFKNLITGFKWNYNANGTIDALSTVTGLRDTTMRFMYSKEINKLKGIISKTGQIEKTIDYAEKWTTLTQLITYAKSLIVQNSNIVNQVELEYDINQNLKIGDIIEINAPNYFINGKFAVQRIDYTYYNELKQIWKITLKNANILYSYIDLFRPQEVQENEDSLNSILLSEFIEEAITETHTFEEVE